MLIRYRSSFTLAAHPETGPLASAVKLFYTRRYTRGYLLLAIVICLCNGLYWFPLCAGLLQGYQPASNVAGLLGPFKQLLWQDGGCASFSWQLQLLLLSSSLFCVKTCCPAQQSKALYLGQS